MNSSDFDRDTFAWAAFGAAAYAHYLGVASVPNAVPLGRDPFIARPEPLGAAASSLIVSRRAFKRVLRGKPVPWDVVARVCIWMNVSPRDFVRNVPVSNLRTRLDAIND
jgi:hypothetical protein